MKLVISYAAIAVGSAWIAITVVLVLILVRGADRRSTCRAVLIPAYLSPSSLAELLHSPNRPRMVIINPSDGPGAEEHRSYREAVRELQASGTRVLGYVATGYGSRAADAVVDDVDRYLRWYRVDGTFFDEAASDAAEVPYYRALAQHARGGVDRLVVLNPGVVPARVYFEVADVVVTFEGAYANYERAMLSMPGWLRSERPERIAHLVYGASRAQALNAVAQTPAGYIYVTSGSLPNPWRTLPAYLREEEEALASCR